MNPDLSQEAIDKIESLCEGGCENVNQLLTKARAGNQLEELSEFSGIEIEQIIDELNKIMAIYEADADIDDHESKTK